MKILLLGMNHRSAPLAIRERFAVDDLGPALRKLVACDEVAEAVVVSTCNRVDLVVTTEGVEAARHRLRHFLAHELVGEVELPAGEGLENFVYEHLDRDAVRHIFRVASSIDSMVVGEPQILGQMKDAYRAAVEFGSCGPVLSRLFQRSFATAKRVRNETGVAERPVSVARVAVDLARQIFEDFHDKTALLVGAGEMIELALHALAREGLERTLVANRTRANAQELAERFGASAHGLDELGELLPLADVVLTCIASDGVVLDKAALKASLHARRQRATFLIDLGVPRNVDPAVNELDDAYLYDIDDLQGVAASNAEQRQREAARAERIVLEEQQRFEGWLVALEAVPTIRHLRARAEAVRERELERVLARMDLDPEHQKSVDLLTRSIVNKILHAPLSRLRAETDRAEGMLMLEAARALFGLDDPPEASAEEDTESDSASEDD